MLVFPEKNISLAIFWQNNNLGTVDESAYLFIEISGSKFSFYKYTIFFYSLINNRKFYKSFTLCLSASVPLCLIIMSVEL